MINPVRNNFDHHLDTKTIIIVVIIIMIFILIIIIMIISAGNGTCWSNSVHWGRSS